MDRYTIWSRIMKAVFRNNVECSRSTQKWTWKVKILLFFMGKFHILPGLLEQLNSMIVVVSDVDCSVNVCYSKHRVELSVS